MTVAIGETSELAPMSASIIAKHRNSVKHLVINSCNDRFIPLKEEVQPHQILQNMTIEEKVDFSMSSENLPCSFTKRGPTLFCNIKVNVYYYSIEQCN